MRDLPRSIFGRLITLPTSTICKLPHVTLSLSALGRSSTAHENRISFNFAGNDDKPRAAHDRSPEGTANVGTPGVTIARWTAAHTRTLPHASASLGISLRCKDSRCAGYGVYYQRVSNQSLLQTSGGLPFGEALSVARLR